ncbi:hypothetical protein Agub_g2189 [Astrephomene gubernaculifera]|uniref:Uncharacterized protein n=1 Tax=Astrephomene gubernaculifera TaxID=47775 RepID=A0AAD3HHX6_9CHLO|nr:hypothetical protein Agub_g2189 [Astrephomene gubernaculifera]
MTSVTIVAGPRPAFASRHSIPFASRPRATTLRRTVVRAQPNDDNTKPPELEPTVTTREPSLPPPSAPTMSTTEEYQGPTGQLAVLGSTQEAINGRAAMLGFVAALISEAATHQAVWSQIAGRYIDGDLVEAPHGTATLLFGAVVGLTTMATLVPKLVGNLEVDSKSFGPFTPARERLVGRVAQLGFAGLLIAELVKGSALLG